MRKWFFSAVTFALMGSMTLSSCIGSFGLFNTILEWNKGVSNKFVNELVFVLISPAYVVSAAVDLFVLNTVEFWSGSNPIAGTGKVENVWGRDGKLYAVKSLKDGYEITKPTGEKVMFVYNAEEDSWAMQADGRTQELFRFNQDGTIQTVLPSGDRMDVTLDDAGVGSLRMAMGNGYYFD